MISGHSNLIEIPKDTTRFVNQISSIKLSDNKKKIEFNFYKGIYNIYYTSSVNHVNQN